MMINHGRSEEERNILICTELHNSCASHCLTGVELLVNKPSIRMYILMLDTRNVEQMKYVLCTLKNIYSSRCSHIAVHGTGLD